MLKCEQHTGPKYSLVTTDQAELSQKYLKCCEQKCATLSIYAENGLLKKENVQQKMKIITKFTVKKQVWPTF